MKTLSSRGDRAVEREAHRRDLPTPVPYGPSGEQLLSVGRSTWHPCLLGENIRAPAVLDFRARDTPRQAKAQEPEMNHSCSVRDKGQTLHPSAAPRRQVLIAQSLARLQPSATYTILFLDQPTKGGWCSDSRPTSPAAFATLKRLISSPVSLGMTKKFSRTPNMLKV